MPLFAVLITSRDILKREPKIEDLSLILQKYQRREVINFLGKLNCLLGTWKNEPNVEWDSKFANYLLPQYALQLNAIRRGKAVRLLFSRLTLLYVLKQACLSCPDEGLPVTTVTGRSDMGVSCLIANDLAVPFTPSRVDDT